MVLRGSKLFVHVDQILLVALAAKKDTIYLFRCFKKQMLSFRHAETFHSDAFKQSDLLL